MYRDNTLIPSEAIRLLALGLLAGRDFRYGELAGEVRHFTGHIVGPSLDLVGTPIEVLKVEGLIEAVQDARVTGDAGDDQGGENALLRVTEAGRGELIRLLAANLRPPVSNINKLIVTLKMRFLHLLPPHEQGLQVEAMAEMCRRQLVRFTELRAHHAADSGQLTPWLDLEIAQLRARLDWFENLYLEGD